MAYPYAHNQNFNGYLGEIFNYGYVTDPHGLMHEDEIPVEDNDYFDDYPRTNHYQQMQQFYYDDDNNQYGNRGYNNHNDRHNYPYAPQRIPFEQILEEAELPSELISVTIRLSSSRFLNNLDRLYYRGNLSCEVRRDNVIVVTGYPSSSSYRTSANALLELVREISGDSRAALE